jgi:hypothetical protein
LVEEVIWGGLGGPPPKSAVDDSKHRGGEASRIGFTTLLVARIDP